jgi:hypothetical protein
VWVPRDETELRAAVDRGDLRETSTLDVKAALPTKGKNKDLARDICAMTVDGGVLIYGVGGDDPTRPDGLIPIELAGAAERIDLVAQGAISEPPTIEIHDIAAADAPGHGFLIVEIPASPRAPHMVTSEGENRYYGRGATGNRILTEGEVARLYARREKWDIDRAAWLDEAVAAMPFSFDDPIEHIGPMVVLVRPVASPRGLLDRARGDQDMRHFLQRDVSEHARRLDPYRSQGTSGLGDALDVTRRGAGVWVTQIDRDFRGPYQARCEYSTSGQLTYWHAPAINSRIRRDADVAWIMERSVTRAVFQTLTAAALIYQRGGYSGAVDVGVALLGIEDASGAALSNTFEGGPRYGAPDFRENLRTTTTDLRRDPEQVTRELLAGLFDVIAPRDYDPFADRDR